MVVDDSAVARTMIIKGLSAQPGIEVVGYAVNAQDAKQKLAVLKPDVMTLDVEMPGLSGIDFLKELLPSNPLPVILVSNLNLRVFDALSAGAVDFVRKPDMEARADAFYTTLTQKVVIASISKPERKHLVDPRAPAPAFAPNLGTRAVLNQAVIGLGASTGGTEATMEVMRRLPADIPGIVIVQHMPPGFTKMYAERMDRLCAMEVREAVDGDRIQRGLALIAPADFQARVTRVGAGHILSVKPGERVSGHRPSVDALFHSMADTLRVPMVGIILTGMGQDGAEGLLNMRQRGAYTIGQDKESCVVYGMPMVAQEIGAVSIQGSIDKISDILLRHLKSL
jgi:two-component system chemotaxis response regulator CheB